METPLTLIYTYTLRGNLDLLPRLHSFIRTLRKAADGVVYLVDLGASCVPEVWPCALTEGRSTLVVLDAMGYHAANVSAVLTPASREKLAGQVTLALVDDAHPHTQDGILFITHLPADDVQSVPALQVILTPAPITRLDANTLYLAPVDSGSGQVGIVHVEGDTIRHEVHPMPASTPPDPTIAGTVDFVRDEARHFEKTRRD